VARYEYGPFGEVIRATGPMAKANPFRFSTKYQDDETDLAHYGYRYYSASTGKGVVSQHLTSAT
jgi:RHS repeat-associated protein